jgi:hypothetical protein
MAQAAQNSLFQRILLTEMTAISGAEHAHELWAVVTVQVEKQGLSLGVHAKLPEKIPVCD